MPEGSDEGGSQAPRSWVMTKSDLSRVAQEELNETAKTRRMALKEIREWIRNQEDTEKYR